MAKKRPNEELANIASNYDVLKEFREQDRRTYDLIVKRGLVQELCGHMKRACLPPGTLNKRHCHLVALNYSARTDFFKGSRSEYCAAQRNGWLNDICGHMVPRSNWRKRKIYAFIFSDGYAYVGLTLDPSKRRSQHLCENHSAVFKHIKKTGVSFEFIELTDWLNADIAGTIEDDYIQKYADDGWKMLNTRRGGSLGSPRQTCYTHERLVSEIAKYEYYEDFMKGARRFYNFLVSRHLLEDYCSRMKHRKTPHYYWTLEQSISTATSCDSRMELNHKYPGAYEVLRRAGMLKKLFPLNKGLPKETHLTRIAECHSRSELYFKHQSTYNWALRNKVLEKYFPAKGNKRTEEENMEIIKSCKSRKELQIKYPGAYEWGLRNNVLDEYFPVKNRPLTEEEKIDIISCCQSRKELHDKHRRVHKWAKDNGLLDMYFPPSTIS